MTLFFLSLFSCFCYNIKNYKIKIKFPLIMTLSPSEGRGKYDKIDLYSSGEKEI